MAKAAARENDKITATDTHAVQMENSVKNETFNFDGPITRDLSSNVKINGRAAAVVGSGAKNSPSHTPSSGSFVNTPTNQGTVATGSASVRINGKAAARHDDPATTCTEPPTPGNGKVEVQNLPAANVLFGG